MPAHCPQDRSALDADTHKRFVVGLETFNLFCLVFILGLGFTTAVAGSTSTHLRSETGPG